MKWDRNVAYMRVIPQLSRWTLAEGSAVDLRIALVDLAMHLSHESQMNQNEGGGGGLRPTK